VEYSISALRSQEQRPSTTTFNYGLSEAQKNAVHHPPNVADQTMLHGIRQPKDGQIESRGLTPSESIVAENSTFISISGPRTDGSQNTCRLDFDWGFHSHRSSGCRCSRPSAKVFHRYFVEMSLTLHTARINKARPQNDSQVVGDACANGRGNENSPDESVANHDFLMRGRSSDGFDVELGSSG
jgi:hypothetical protein